MAGLIPFLIAVIIASTAAEGRNQPLFGEHWQHAPWSNVGLLLGGGLLMWFALCGIGANLVASRARHRLLVWWDTTAQGLALAVFAVLCYGIGWSRTVPGTALAVLPFVAMMLIHWWWLATAVRAVTGHHWTRAGMVLYHLRFSAVPLLIGIVAITDLVSPLSKLFDGTWLVIADIVGLELMLVAMLLLVPPLMVRMWGARSMEDGPLRDRLRQACDAMGVRVADIMRWPVPGGRMYNAAVVGVVPRLRYLLFSDDLLRDLNERQLLAVLGHELGHVRYAHLWLYFLFVNVAMAASGLLNRDALDWMESLPWSDRLSLDLQQGLAYVLVLFVLFRLVFGVLSRACERQADLAGVDLAGDPLPMQEALRKVAAFSGQPENSRNWRHYSIAQRIDFLERLKSQPALSAVHHRMVGSLRFFLSLMLVVTALSWFSNHFLDPDRTAAANPAARIDEMRHDDPDLGAALDTADRGDPLELLKWFGRAEPEERERIVELHLALATPRDDQGQRHEDDRVLYQYRNRFRAFTSISTGRGDLDRELDNTLAYGLVAGTDQPTADDVQLARSLLPRLEKTAAALGRRGHAVLDTIGCVYFLAGDYRLAHESFESALKGVEKDQSFPPKALELYRRRVEAAAHNWSVVQGASTANLVGLPLDLPEGAPKQGAPPAAAPSAPSIPSEGPSTRMTT